jgi:uncharacterized protein YuzE
MKNQYNYLDTDEYAKANMDLSNRLYEEGVSIDYDEDADTLFLTIGKGVEAISEQLVDGVYFRIDPYTQKIAGFVVLRFASDILENNKLFKALFQTSFEQLKAQGGSVEWKGAQAKKMEPLFALVVR